MQLVAVGAEPVGIIAIGANATGLIAVGQLATGVIAVGQLARGVVAVGQLAGGVVAVGQLSFGLLWAAGMVGLGGYSGPGLVLGLFGRLYPSRLRRPATGPPLVGTSAGATRRVLAGTGVAALAVAWWFAVGVALADAMTRTGGIFVDPPRVLR